MIHSKMGSLSILFLLALTATNGNGSLPNPYTVEDIINSRCKIKPTRPPCFTGGMLQELGNTMTMTYRHDHDYASKNLMYNRAMQRETSLIAMVMSKEDIQKAVLFALESDLLVTIKSTGHDYLGRSTWQDSFVIHLGLMKNIEVNPNPTARSQHGELKTETGTSWKTIYKLLDNYDRVIVGGSAHTVGPGGYTLGGGHSPISRSLGYAVDNVLEMQVVLADGSIATCTENQTVIEHVNGTTKTRDDGDLLWALRGGGGGTFGVTVYIVFKLHPQPSEMVLFSGTFPFFYESAYINAYFEVMLALKNFILNSPNHWGGYWIISGIANRITVPKPGSVYLFMNKFGPMDDDTMKELSEFLTLKEKYDLQDIRLESKTSFWDFEQNANDPDSADVYLATSMLDRENAVKYLENFFREELFNHWQHLPFGCTGTLVGGKTMEPSLESTPLSPGYRSAVSVMSCGIDLTNRADRNDLIDKAKDFAYRIRLMGQGMSFNEASMDSRYWREDCWGKSNYERLVQIKERYDRDNFFTCYHCVNSDTSPYPPEQSEIRDYEIDGSTQTQTRWFSLILAIVVATCF